MNELEHLEDFQQILTNYEVSHTNQKTLHQTTLVLCSAPTATGRNTVIRELVKTGKYYFIVSDTTRKPRINDGVPEQDGVEYWFRSEPEMLADLRAGKFLEAEIIHSQQVSGISIREVAKAQTNHQIAITDADRGGVRLVRKAKPDTICLFFLPPSFEEWQRRVNGRGDMPDKEKHRRFTTAIHELENALANNYYKFVINDVLADAVTKVEAIVTDPQHTNEAEQAKARALAQDILGKTKALLG